MPAAHGLLRAHNMVALSGVPIVKTWAPRHARVIPRHAGHDRPGTACAVTTLQKTASIEAAPRTVPEGQRPLVPADTQLTDRFAVQPWCQYKLWSLQEMSCP